MKKVNLLIASALFLQLSLNAQTWVSTGYPTDMVWQAAELNGNLYTAAGASGIYKYDGNTWTLENGGSKSSIVNIEGLLYCGARDFSTNGENNVQTYDGTNYVSLGGADFPYHGNAKIFDFVKYNGEIYAGGQFTSSAINQSGNIARWTGTQWEGVGNIGMGSSANWNNPVKRLLVAQNKLYVVAASRIYFYDGAAWDSIPTGMFADNFTDAAVYNGNLVVSGFIYQYENGNPVGGFRVATWDGSSFQNIPTPYYEVNRLLVNNSTLFAIVQEQGPNFSPGDVWVASWDGSAWSNAAFLQPVSGGVNPGYPLSDYYRIFFYNNDLYVGGRFTNVGGESIQSLAKFNGSTQTLTPNAPTNLAATAFKTAAGYIQLTWTDNATNEDGFKVLRSTDGVQFTEVASLGVDVQTYDDNAITDLTQYSYRVVAYNTSGNSAESNTVIVTSGTVGIEAINNSNSLLNWNSDNKMLSISGLQNQEVVIVGINGNIILRKPLTSTKQDVSLSNLASGLYLARVGSATKHIFIH